VRVYVLQFKAPIANVWALRNQKLTQVSLFSSHVVPGFKPTNRAADDEDFAEELRSPDVEPLLYIGVLFVIFVSCLDYSVNITLCVCWTIL